MTYFLDFDRTLINSERLLDHFAALPGLGELGGTIRNYTKALQNSSAFNAETREEMYRGIDKLYADGTYAFQDGELTSFLYDDVQSFLKAHGSEVVVVTSGHGTLAFQKAKLSAAGISDLVDRVVIVQEEDQHKGPVLAKLIHEHPAPYYFVDDKESQLDVVAAAAPDVVLYHMVRSPVTKPSARYTVISSLKELL